jgi:exopolysaccharide biosynthesis polyprenyl glycosylphosphotransferase
MLRRNREIRAQLHQVLDAGLYGFAFWLAHLIREHIDFQPFGGPGALAPSPEYKYLYLVIFPISPLILSGQGFYARALNCSRREILWPLLKSCSLMTAWLITIIWLFRTGDVYSRAVVLLSGPIAFALIFGKEESIRWVYRTKLGRAQMKRRLILIGTSSDLARLREELSKDMADELSIVREVDLNKASIADVIHLLHEHSVSSVVLNARNVYFGLVEKVIEACELEGVEVWLIADFFKTQISKTTLDDLYGKPVLVFRSAPETSWQMLVKTGFDFVGSAIGLVLLSPIFLLVAIVIRRSSPGPVFFKQRRSGLNGEPFTMYKFRTMVTNAEQLRAELASLNEMTGPVFKITSDPRVTRIGRWLRKFSVDEWPQLLNVLKGEMSIVGPRPLPVDEVQRFDDLAHRRRLSVKPGLTCLWQVRGRNNVRDFRDWVRMDLEYIDNWSIWLDFKIVIQTIPVVLFAKGAK